MKLDILVCAAHPDDAELGCSGTIALHIALGKKVGVIDFTRGELGTRGSIEERAEEAKNSSRVLGLSARENLGFADGFFENNKEHQLKLIQVIRKYQPEIVFANAIRDRHIDHARAGKLANDACFLSGLRKIETQDNEGNLQEAWRPKAIYHYIQDYYINPDIVIDVTKYWDIKMQSIQAFKTQFFNPESSEPTTPISTPDFLEFLKSRAMEMGRPIGVKYAEGFTKESFIGVKNIFDLI